MILGVDFGATNGCAQALEHTADPTRPRLLSDPITFPVDKNNFEISMRRFEEVVRKLEAIHGPTEEIGADVAGRLNGSRTQLVIAGNLEGWVGHPLAARVATITPEARRRVLGNDGLAQALYEALTNPVLKGVNFLLVSIGTGIAIAWIICINGQPVGIPAEGSHIVLSRPMKYANRKKCGCGQYGCMERHGSSDGAQQRFGKKPEDITPDEWVLVANDQARGIANLLQTNVLVNTVVYAGLRQQPKMLGFVDEYLAAHAHKTRGVRPVVVKASCDKLNAALAGYMLLHDTGA